MTPTDIRKALVSIIQNMGENTEHYVREPGRDFCRRRKLPFETMLATILGMGGSSLTNELLDCFGCAEELHLPLRSFSKEPRYCRGLSKLYFNHLPKLKLDNIFIKITSCSLSMDRICYVRQIRQIRTPIFQG